MKNAWIIVVILVAILVFGYLGRHKIKSLLGMNPAPVAQTQTAAPSSSPSPSSASMLMTRTDPSKGAYLADSKGMTLYVFDKDTKGVSNCYSGCAKVWPPFLAPSADTSSLPVNVTLAKRTDGTLQYAYNGMPLYYYAQDSKPGDITGDGIGGTWHLVKP